ncbi:MarR family winged helix-turn-helix transcriptional regulator [Thiohalorhabdus sp.]|uniref:MarR family winged helix-turn-helix transcriptional regulator n=1 Tax=Thiohalorhabdus sp. TaxID=3094134 RepID=UPI002FC2B564
MSLNRWESLGFVINHLARLLATDLADHLRPHEVTIGQYPLLLALWEEEGITQTGLSLRLNIEPATTTNTLNRMERDGLVERQPDPDDQRGSRIYLTDHGRALEEPVTKAARAVNARAQQNLSAGEAVDLGHMLAKVRRGLEKE